MTTASLPQSRRKQSFRRAVLFSLLLACGCLIGCNQTNQPTSETKPAAAGPPAAQQVKDFLTHKWTSDCRSFEECRLTFDSEVSIGAAVRHQFPNGANLTAYPVKVDFSFFKRNTSINEKGFITRHRGGVYYFYQDEFQAWQMQSENVETTQQY